MLARLATAFLLATSLAAAPAYQGTSAGRAVVLTRDDLRVGPALSLRQAWLRGFDEPSGGHEEHDISWRLLSVVGPLVSVETHGSGYAEGAAHPYAYADITAYDARTGKPAQLTDWFAARDVHAALMGDGLVKKALAGARPATLPALLKAIAGYQSEDCVWGFSDDLLEHFAFHHVAGNRVAVRFGLQHGCEVARGSLTILAVYLPIPAALRADLAAAQAGRAGFLVPRAPKGEAKASLVRGKKPKP